jgi:UPF0716 family protein affecting phage T7 exclusion
MFAYHRGMAWFVALDIALAVAGLIVLAAAGIWLWRRVVAVGRQVRGATGRLSSASAELSRSVPRR